MKLSSILILILISVSSCSQTVTINDVNKAIDAKLNDYSKTLDSTIVKKSITGSGVSIVMDTLNLGSSKGALFSLTITASNTSTGEIASGEKRVTVRKSGVLNRVVKDFNVMPFSGDSSLNNASWVIQTVNGAVVVRVTGVFNKTIQWTLTKQAQY